MVSIKFGTDGWRAIIAQDYTTANVARVAHGTAKWIRHKFKQNPSVVIGHDCRFGGPLFSEVTAKVMASQGVKVYLAKDFVSTPMISLGTKKLGASLGVVITASHNPPEYSGFKLKSMHGGPSLPEEIAEVEALVPDVAEIPYHTLEDYQKRGELEFVDLESMYYQQVEETLDLEKLREMQSTVAYDAMFGAGKRVFKRLLPQAHILHDDDNPGFHGRAPEPIHKNLPELSKLMAGSKKLAVGLATDGDADRIGMYDTDGNFIDAHHIILLLIHYLKKYKQMDGKVVVAFSTSVKIPKLCEHYGLDYEITQIGFKYICGHMITEDVLLGGEESGGIAVKGHIPERDGIWDALLILEFMGKSGKSIKALIKEVYDIVGPFAYNRNDLHISEEQKQEIIQNCKSGKYKTFGKYTVEKVEDLDGFKFYLGGDTTLMIRPSGTEPLLRVYCEAPTAKEVEAILKAAQETLLG